MRVKKKPTLNSLSNLARVYSFSHCFSISFKWSLIKYKQATQKQLKVEELVEKYNKSKQ